MNNDHHQQGDLATGVGQMYADWKARTPVASRSIVWLVLILAVGPQFLAPFTSLCIRDFFEDLQIWRFFTSPFFAGDFGSLFAPMFLYFCASKIERIKGTVFVFHSWIVMMILSNALFVLIGGAIAYNPWSRSELVDPVSGVNRDTDEVEEIGKALNPSFTSAGQWPVVFGALVLEVTFSINEQRQFLCCPWMIATKWYPVFLLFLFELMSFGKWKIDIVCGLFAGYLYAQWITYMQISPTRTRAWENKSWLNWLTSKDNFVGIDNTGTALAGTALAGVWLRPSDDGQQMPLLGPFSAAQRGTASQNGSGSDAFGQGRGSVIGVRDERSQGQGSASGGAPQASSRAVFKGQGHSLGSDLSGSASAPQKGSRSHPLAARFEQQRTRTNEDTDATDTDTLLDIDAPPSTSSSVTTIPHATIQQMMELGYTRDDCIPALEFSSGDIPGAIAFMQGEQSGLSGPL